MDQLIGKMLDNRYEILDVIGVGGMSVVYKAYCHRLHRFVAIKVLKKDLAGDDEFRRRFHEEAQAVAMLSHPNIVAVYDVSKGADLDYIVMELIDGITLKQYMRKKDGKLNWREALYFANQIVQALGHAHGRGIIHRDIKPQNIMVLRDGSVKVADFGIARIMSVSQSSTLTQEALGSVHYISPEQARGSHIDARADIYSAGVVLYEMLTGRLPFDGDTPVSVALQHINATPLAPREIDPEIPAGLEEITMKAMAPRIDLRYLNAEAMIQDLEEFRKDPEITFHYNLASFRGSQPEPDEPTQKVDTPPPPARRQRVRHKVPASASERGRDYDEDEEAYEDEEGGHRRLVIPIVVVVCLVAAAVGLWLAFFSGIFEKAEMVEVPYLLGRTLTEVYEDPGVMDNFQVNRVSTEFSDVYKEGEIISQDPTAHISAEKGTTINVVVSGGQEYLEMIDVLDMSYEKAVAQLEGMGLVVEEPETENSDTIAEGNVISSSPEAGAPVLPGDSVHLVISLGEEIKTVRMPNVTGQTLESARVTLTSQGLTIAGVTEVTNDRPQGQVIFQSIPEGTEVEEGTSLTLQVSKGPAEPEVQNVVVPTVTGQTLDRARSLLSGADLRIASVNEVDSDAPAGQVVYQSIPAGTSVEEGTSISLQVSRGPTLVPEPQPEPEPAPETEEPDL